MNREIIAIMSLLLITAVNCSGQTSASTNEEYSSNPPDFASFTSYDEMRAATFNAEKAHPHVTTAYAADLVRQVQRQSASNEAQVCAIYLIGQLRITNAVAIAVLIDKIDLRPTRTELALRIVPWGHYPAEEALMKIGAPTVPPITSRLSAESNDLRRYLMCEVLKSVESKGAAIDQLKQNLALESNPSKKTNLELSLKELEK